MKEHSGGSCRLLKMTTFFLIMLSPAFCGGATFAAPPEKPELTDKQAAILDKIMQDPALSEEEKKRKVTSFMRMLAEGAVKNRQEEKDRKELVISAPPDFKPEPVDRKLKITLIPEKTMIRAGQKFRYRLEIQNVGRETIAMVESDPSFIKTGDLLHTREYKFYVTPHAGPEQEMEFAYEWKPPQPRVYEEIHFPDAWTPAQKQEAIKQMNLEAHYSSEFHLKLRPGETLTTRSDSPPPNRFRDLIARPRFNKPGTYRIKVVFDDLGDHPYIKREKEREKRIQNFKLSPKEMFENEMKVRRKLGLDVSPGWQKRQRDQDVKEYEKWKQRAVGRIESNIIELEVAP